MLFMLMMSKTDRMLRIAAGILVGSPLYFVLNWIPLLGPFISGFISGRITGGRGFLVGFLSGISGFALLVFLAFPRLGISNSLLLMWVMLFWHFIAIIISAVGGALGSASGVMKGFSWAMGREARPERREVSAEVLIVCSRCGTGNAEISARCKECGEAL